MLTAIFLIVAIFNASQFLEYKFYDVVIAVFHNHMCQSTVKSFMFVNGHVATKF